MPDLDPYDQLNATDDSQVVDQSAGSNTQSYLQNREKNPGQAHENAITSHDNLTKRENEANKNAGISSGRGDSRKIGANSDGISRNGSGKSGGFSYLGGKGKNGGKSKMNLKGKIKKRVAMTLLTVILGGGGFFVGMNAPVAFLSNIGSILRDRFIEPKAMTTKTHDKNLWKCKLSTKCLKGANDPAAEKQLEGPSKDNNTDNKPLSDDDIKTLENNDVLALDDTGAQTSTAADTKTLVKGSDLGNEIASAITNNDTSHLSSTDLAMAKDISAKLTAGTPLDPGETVFMKSSSGMGKVMSTLDSTAWNDLLSANSVDEFLTNNPDIASKVGYKPSSSTNEGMSAVSDKAAEDLAGNGSDFNNGKGSDSGGPIKLPDNTEVTDTNIENNLTPLQEGEFQKSSVAADPVKASLSGDATETVFAETGTGENVPTSDEVGDDNKGDQKTIGQQLDDQQAHKSSPTDYTAESAAATTHVEPTSLEFVKSSGGSSDDTKVGFDAPQMDDIANEEAVKTVAEADMEEGKKAASDSNNGAGIKMLLGLACGLMGTTTGALRAYNVGTKLWKYRTLISFAFTAMPVISAIMANQPGAPTSEQVNQLFSSLTTVLKSSAGLITTKSASDSFGLNMAQGFLRTKGSNFDMTNAKANVASPTGLADDFTNQVTNSGGMNFTGQNIWSTIGNWISGAIGSGIISTGCSVVGDALAVDQAGGPGAKILKDLLNGESIVADLGNAAAILGGLISSAGSFIGGDAGDTIGKIGATMNLGTCTNFIGASGVLMIAQTTAGCVVAALGAAAAWFLPGFINTIITNFEHHFLVYPTPVGANQMDAITSGMGMFTGANAGAGGVAALSKTNGENYLNTLVTYNQQQDAIARTQASPFDITNSATFLGSIMGNFAMSLYSNGNSPLGIASSLLGMFGSTFANFANNLSPAAMADTNSAYLNSCNDADSNATGYAVDPFCNVMYGQPTSDFMDVETVMNDLSAADMDNGLIVDPANTVYGLLAHGSSYSSAPDIDPDGQQTVNSGPQYYFNWCQNTPLTADDGDKDGIDELKNCDGTGTGLEASLRQFDFDYVDPNYECGQVQNNNGIDEESLTTLVSLAPQANSYCHHYGTITDWIQECVTRNFTMDTTKGTYTNKPLLMPMGENDGGAVSSVLPIITTSGNGYMYDDGSGNDTIHSVAYGANGNSNGDKAINCTPSFGENNLLYNYVQYYMDNSGIQQGADYGQQADNSATS